MSSKGAKKGTAMPAVPTNGGGSSAPVTVAPVARRADEAAADDQAEREAEKQLRQLCTTFLKCCAAEGGASAPAATADAPSAAATALQELRKSILLKPMPNLSKTVTSCSIRGWVWQLLLGVQHQSASAYSDLVALGSCQPKELYSKIRGDAFRTFQDDAQFWHLVQDEHMSRVLNAFVHKQSKTFFKTSQGQDKVSPFTYLQGMNAISGCFLYCMTEVDAFYAFSSFITEKTPLYWVSSHIGANAGCKLVDAVLSVVDPQLAAHLAATTPGAYVYAFHCVSGFCSTIRPLSEVLKLWDFLLAFGPHFNVLCVAAQVVLVRSQLLASDNPKSILDYRVWPSLQASLTISVAMSFLPQLSKQLYHQITQHATNPEVAEAISGTPMHENTRDIKLV